jgi:hypothetical protein
VRLLSVTRAPAAARFVRGSRNRQPIETESALPNGGAHFIASDECRASGKGAATALSPTGMKQKPTYHAIRMAD